MVISTAPQRSEQWYKDRKGKFTASDLGEWALNPVAVKLTIEQAKAHLDSLGIKYSSKDTKGDLLAKIPDLAPFFQLSTAARNAIISTINDEREKDEWEIQMEEQEERKLSYSIPIQRGIALEPEAREWYLNETGNQVIEVGFITSSHGGFGCSPDGLIKSYPTEFWSKGLEIKCPMPETHLRWLLDGVLPDDHKLQCHAGMAVTDLKSWDFLSYCPGEAPLLVTVEWDDYTSKLQSGLIELVKQKAIIKSQLRALWDAAYNKSK